MNRLNWEITDNEEIFSVWIYSRSGLEQMKITREILSISNTFQDFKELFTLSVKVYHDVNINAKAAKIKFIIDGIIIVMKFQINIF